jgi:hypothetical protein
LNYAPVVKKTIDKNTRFALQTTLECKDTSDWTAALGQCEKIKNRKADDKQKVAQEALTKLAAMKGRFPRELAADLAPIVEKNDVAALQQLVSEAPQRPQRWLVSEYLRW